MDFPNAKQPLPETIDVPSNVESLAYRIAVKRAEEYKDYLFENLVECNLQYLGSPIEQILLAHLVLLGSGFYTSENDPLGKWYADSRDFSSHLRLFEKFRTARYATVEPFFFISHQVAIGPYRADFLVSHANGIDFRLDAGSLIEGKYFENVAHVFVECDGHDFHEKTKEQAARDKKRDRIIQGTGIPILRFSGSEIYNDPIGCVNEINRNLTGRCRGKEGFDAVDEDEAIEFNEEET